MDQSQSTGQLNPMPSAPNDVLCEPRPPRSPVLTCSVSHVIAYHQHYTAHAKHLFVSSSPGGEEDPVITTAQRSETTLHECRVLVPEE